MHLSHFALWYNAVAQSCLAAFADRVIWAAQEQLVPKAQGRMCKKRQKSQVLEYEIFSLTIFTKSSTVTIGSLVSHEAIFQKSQLVSAV